MLKKSGGRHEELKRAIRKASERLSERDLERMREVYRNSGGNPVRATLVYSGYDQTQYMAGWEKMGLDFSIGSAGNSQNRVGRKSENRYALSSSPETI